MACNCRFPCLVPEHQGFKPVAKVKAQWATPQPKLFSEPDVVVVRDTATGLNVTLPCLKAEARAWIAKERANHGYTRYPQALVIVQLERA